MSRESSTTARAKQLSPANDRRFLGNAQMIHSDAVHECTTRQCIQVLGRRMGGRHWQ